MEVISVATGSWFPRTKLHLKEYFAFLKGAGSHLPLDPAALKAACDKLRPEAPVYVGGRFDLVTARFDGLTADYHEDGVLVVTKPASADVAADVAALREFYDSRISPALALIYSLGTPVLMPAVKHEGRRPVFITMKNATDGEAAALLERLGETAYHVARQDGVSVHYAENVIVISGGDEALVRMLLVDLILFREYEHKLRHFLDIHRSTWDSIERLRSKQTLSLKELPAIRDQLLDHQRDFAILRARLSQMDSYLDERRAEIDDLGLTRAMRGLEAYRFAKLRSATGYIDRLWTMFQDYLSSTLEITGLMYQENLQKEIKIEQFIFLLGAVAAIIGLGILPTSDLRLFGTGGQLISTGQIVTFSVYDLVVMGGAAVLATFLILSVVRPLVSSFRRIRATSLLGANSPAPAAIDHKK